MDTGPAFIFSTLSREIDLSHTSPTGPAHDRIIHSLLPDRLWKQKLGPGYYSWSPSDLSLKPKFALAPRWGPGIGLTAGSDPAMGPGKYRLDNYVWTADAPGFTMPTNEVVEALGL